jgi:hypothetical protein
MSEKEEEKSDKNGERFHLGCHDKRLLLLARARCASVAAAGGVARRWNELVCTSAPPPPPAPPLEQQEPCLAVTTRARLAGTAGPLGINLDRRCRTPAGGGTCPIRGRGRRVAPTAAHKIGPVRGRGRSLCGVVVLVFRIPFDVRSPEPELASVARCSRCTQTSSSSGSAAKTPSSVASACVMARPQLLPDARPICCGRAGPGRKCFSPRKSKTIAIVSVCAISGR